MTCGICGRAECTNVLGDQNGRVARAAIALAKSCLRWDAEDFKLSLREGQLQRLPEIRERMRGAGEQLRWLYRALPRIDQFDEDHRAGARS